MKSSKSLKMESTMTASIDTDADGTCIALHLGGSHSDVHKHGALRLFDWQRGKRFVRCSGRLCGYLYKNSDAGAGGILKCSDFSGFIDV